VIRDPEKASGALAGPHHGEALRIAEERFRLIMENVEDFAIFLLDLEGRVVDWNQGTERLLGYRAEEILGKHFGSFFTPDDQQAQRPARTLKQAAATGRAEDETWLVRKDGSCFWASGTVTALLDERGSLRGYVQILRDLTDKNSSRRPCANGPKPWRRSISSRIISWRWSAISSATRSAPS
jgi:PAS domain S-box-containing protein